ncbi:chromosome segregation protein SMC [Catenibacillus scindens]|uniref:chromosome segregation protein SMC n=1 Tax=Catenibacillus scindens TaxID=673271 RepID=UPI0032098B4F
MYLKSIEIQGFKSFANKISLKFHKGITGIVGPNGSGKSNVADAVRWVLGEQSAKQLRGSKMEDVIFSGTESRKPLGFAYVAITLDNSDHKLAIAYDEVTVARRVYRSGESEYLINGSACRLKDVQELFFDTGIGKEGYSIIGQGQIDKILSGKPEERRELFDEAAGIVKFKKRKQAAQKNLEAEKQNLCRVNDILSELEKQVGPLKRQADTARTYLKMRDHLKLLDVHLYIAQYSKIKEDMRAVDEKLEIVNGDINQTQQQLDKTREEYDRLEQEMESYDQAIEEKRVRQNESRINREKLSGQLKLAGEQMNSIRQNVENGQIRIEKLEESILEKKSDIARYETSRTGIIEQMDALKVRRDAADEKLAAMSAASSKVKRDIDEKNSAIIDLLNQAASVREKMGRYDTMEEQIHIRRAELNQRLIVLKSQQAQQEEAVAGYEEELKQVLESLDRANTQKASLTKQNETISRRLDQVRQQVSAKQQDFHSANSRYYALKNISERYEGYGSSIKRVMEQKKVCPGIIGVVADIIKVEKKYETAMEIALGGSIQNIVTENEETAKDLIAYLKKNRFGRATFLPLTSITVRGSGPDPKVLGEEGVIGLADSLVSCREKYKTLVRFLLGRVVVVDHIDHALSLARKYKYSLRIVTLDGESLSPGGSLSGGAYKNSGNLLGRSRELDELSKKVETIKQEIDDLNQDQARLQTERSGVRKDLEKVTRSLQELSLNENTVRMTLNQAKSAKSAGDESYAQLSNENEELNRQVADISQSRQKLNDQIKLLDDQRGEAEKFVADNNEKLEKMEQEEKAFGQANEGLRLEFSKLDQSRSFDDENIRRVRGEMESLQKDIETIRRDMDTSADTLAQRQQVADGYAEEIRRLDQVIEEVGGTLEELTQKKELISKDHRDFFTRRETLSDRLGVLDKEQFRLNHQKEKLEEDKTAQTNYMWQEYELTLGSAYELKKDELLSMGIGALKKAADEEKAGIRKLGPVNVNAIEEYENVSQRYDLLKTQHDDLVEAEAKLNGIIDSLDKAMRQQFTEKFKEIGKNFDRVFKELFGGGKASLELMEDEDILYAGIRIIASPPGKKLQNMMMLSGGEKALTAIALLFAIQSLKPSPFCLLDEIEAALDDANVKRYAQYLNNLTKDTQFIIITHRRGTMNAADVLYGITMQEKGVSTLVSVSLIDSKLDD